MDTLRELNLDFSDHHEAVRQNAHRFAKEVLRPAAVAVDRMANPADAIAAGSPLRQALRQAYRLGYHTASLPVEIGGQGLDPLAMHVLAEELSWGSVDLALGILVSGFPFGSVAATGDSELIDKFVRPFVDDQDASMIGCWAITEPQHGSDTLLVGTQAFQDPGVSGQVVARRDGDDYIISGQKAAWVSNGTIATHALAYLTTEPSRGMAGGGIVLIPLDLPGVSRGKPLNKMGQRALNQGEIFFDEVRVPARYMLFGPDFYEMALARTLTFANTTMAAAFTGVARAAYEEALEYSKMRVQGGKPICEHQLVQKHLFEMFTRVEACRALSRAVMLYNQSSAMPSLEHAIAAKTYCTENAFSVASDALQVFGGYGLSKEYVIEKLFRDARASLIEDGTTDALSLAGARSILGPLGSAGA